jgi:hypothetical protein
MPPVFSKLTSFFPPVITDREKANNARNLARIKRVEDSIERRLACLKNLNDKRLELKNQKLREARKRKHDGIDIVAPAPASLTDGAIAIEILSSDDDVTLPNKKKAWTQRPTIWADIAEFYLSVNNSIAATIKQNPNELGGNNDRQNYLCISRWVRDYKAGTVKKSVGGKPIYGNEVDKQLYRTIIKRNDLGLPMDPFIMRTLLMIHLRDAGRSVSPTGIHWNHSESHWQNYATFIKAIENIVIPYKNAKIHELGLPVDQKTILKMDLHFSHKINPARPNELAQELKVLLEMHNIIPFYVPGACTDELQECDTVINKPFKSKVKASFRDYLYRQYETWVSEGNDAEEWAPKFGMAELKPNITGWIQDGIAAIRTPEMKLSIKKAFFTDGRFEEIRSRALSQKKADELQQEYWEELMLYEEPETVEEISSGGDLVIATFEEPDSDLDD